MPDFGQTNDPVAKIYYGEQKGILKLITSSFYIGPKSRHTVQKGKYNLTPLLGAKIQNKIQAKQI